MDKDKFNDPNHNTSEEWFDGADTFANDNSFLYEAKKQLLTQCEQEYYKAILTVLPTNFYVFPQVNLATFIEKTDDSPYRNELFRNVDFLITDTMYIPLVVIEINDQSHSNANRKERDKRVRYICEEAGIPIVTFWTSYGINLDYIDKRLYEAISSFPIPRVHHFNKSQTKKSNNMPPQYPNYRHQRPRPYGCYVATCVYGSYDCPEVWVLRRYRDTQLARSWYGRLFIKLYYATSPTFVKLFGRSQWFHKVFKPFLDKFVSKLSAQGVENTPYNDTMWR